jgi:hypothetical protein
MGSLDRFATKFETIDEAPEPFRKYLAQALSIGDTICLLLYSPSFQVLTNFIPATVLMITDRGWLVVTENSQNVAFTVAESDFENILWLETKNILLYGSLRIFYGFSGGTKSAQVEFNTVMDQLYRCGREILLEKLDIGLHPTNWRLSELIL